MEAEVERMAAEVAESLERREIAGRTVTLKVRYDDFTTVTRSRTLIAPTAAAATIGRCARDLLERTEAASRPVRLLGVTASNLVAGGEGQLWLFEE
jgi:DNA polymerase-4